MDVVISILKRPLFYVWFAVIIILYIVANYSGVWSSSRFVPRVTVENVIVGTNSFIPKKNITDLALGMTYSNITNWDLSRDESADIDPTNISSILKFSQQVEIVSSYDLYTNLQKSSNRKYIIDLYSSDLDQMYAKSQSVIPQISNFIKNQQIEYTNCVNAKKQADTYYNQWLDKNDASLVEYWYRQATEYGDCESKYRITINAYSPIFDKIKTSYIKIKDQRDFVTKNKDLLINNFDLLQWSQLEDLINLKNAVSK